MSTDAADDIGRDLQNAIDIITAHPVEALAWFDERIARTRAMLAHLESGRQMVATTFRRT